MGKSRQKPTESMKRTASRAVTTRLGQRTSPASGSYDDGFFILAKDAAHRVRNFPDRGPGFDCGEHGGHQVFRAAGAAFDLRQGRGGLCGVAAGAEGAKTIHLGAFDSRVDPE